jgi:hypothetical protein
VFLQSSILRVEWFRLPWSRFNDSLRTIRKSGVHSVVRPKSFRAVLKHYEASEADPDRRSHLQRWHDDHRAEEVWREINRAAQNNGKVLPPVVFVRDILGARRIAIVIGNRGKLRKDYRRAADQMKRVANFLRKPHPHGMPSYPRGKELAGMLDKAAAYHRKQVEVRRNLPGVLRVSRESKPEAIFMSMVGNDLNGVTGRWLDKEVAALADSAFDTPEPIEPEAARWARGPRGRRRTSHKRRG